MTSNSNSSSGDNEKRAHAGERGEESTTPQKTNKKKLASLVILSAILGVLGAVILDTILVSNKRKSESSSPILLQHRREESGAGIKSSSTSAATVMSTDEVKPSESTGILAPNDDDDSADQEQRGKRNSPGPASRSSREKRTAKVEEEEEEEGTIKEEHSSPHSPPKLTSKQREEEMWSSCGGRPLPKKERWSCRDHPQRCAFMYQSFVLKPKLMQKILDSETLDEHMWMTVHSALTLRHHYPEVPLLLATNYEKEYLLGILRKASSSLKKSSTVVGAGRSSLVSLLEKELAARSGGSGDGSSTTDHQQNLLFDEILVKPDTAEQQKIWKEENGNKYLLKSDAMCFPSMEKYDRVLFLDGDTIIERREAALTIPTNSKLDYALTYGRCSSLHTPATSSSISGKRKTITTSGTTTVAADGEERHHHQYTDFIDALDSLNYYDLAMVPEYGSFHHLGFTLYYPFSNLTDCETPYEKVTLDKEKYEMKGCAYKYHTRYETQYNTGFVAYRNDPCTVNGFMNRWSKVHRETEMCLTNFVAWDQCSLPMALRQSSVRVGIMPEPFNVREALGAGCSRLLYPKPRGKRFSEAHVIMNHDNKKKEMMKNLLYGGVFSSEDAASSLITCKGTGGHMDGGVMDCRSKYPKK